MIASPLAEPFFNRWRLPLRGEGSPASTMVSLPEEREMISLAFLDSAPSVNSLRKHGR